MLSTLASNLGLTWTSLVTTEFSRGTMTTADSPFEGVVGATFRLTLLGNVGAMTNTNAILLGLVFTPCLLVENI